jgi:hypothetical protein
LETAARWLSRKGVKDLGVWQLHDRGGAMALKTKTLATTDTLGRGEKTATPIQPASSTPRKKISGWSLPCLERKSEQREQSFQLPSAPLSLSKRVQKKRQKIF